MPERKGRLDGKVAIITGAGSSGPGVGNGKAAAVCCSPEKERGCYWQTLCLSGPRRPWL